MGGIKLFFRYLTTGFRVQAQYRGQFVLLITTRFFVDGIHLLGLMALFTRFDSLGGWSLYEVMLFYGMTYMAMGLAESYSHGFHAMARFVRSGDFDRLMLRPRRIFLQILGGEFQFFRMGGLAFAADERGLSGAGGADLANGDTALSIDGIVMK